ncbi:MAG: SurA N-terminal domain-containing protein [Hyphomicrobiaceae bacterium]
MALVNDAPITGYEVEQRSRFMALSTNISDRARANMKAFAQNPATNERLKAILQETIQANRGKSREQVIAAFEARKKAYVTSLQKKAIESARASILPGLKQKALDELIEERLKFQEAKKLSVNIAQSEVEKVFSDMAQRNKMTAKQFEQHIASQGASAEVIKSRLKASLIWRDVVRKRYGHHISVSQREIEQLAASSGGEQALELRLQRITISTPGAVDQQAMAARLVEANALRGQFKGCKSMAQLARGRANARFQDLGFLKPSAVAEPTRSLLMAAKDEEMLPPNLGASGVELYAVCARRSKGVPEDQRKAAENKLTMQQFEQLAQRYLYDLRKDALIEIR